MSLLASLRGHYPDQVLQGLPHLIPKRPADYSAVCHLRIRYSTLSCRPQSPAVFSSPGTFSIFTYATKAGRTNASTFLFIRLRFLYRAPISGHSDL